MQPRTKTKGTKVEGDQFVLCTWPISLRGQPYVIGSSNSINKLCEGNQGFLFVASSTGSWAIMTRQMQCLTGLKLFLKSNHMTWI